MTLHIDLSPKSEAWLAAEAKLRGVQPAEVVRHIVEERAVGHADCAKLTNGQERVIEKDNAAVIALLNGWIKEDSTDDPEEIRKADEEVAELRRALNANRVATGERLVSQF